MKLLLSETITTHPNGETSVVDIRDAQGDSFLLSSKGNTLGGYPTPYLAVDSDLSVWVPIKLQNGSPVRTVADPAGAAVEFTAIGYGLKIVNVGSAFNPNVSVRLWALGRRIE